MGPLADIGITGIKGRVIITQTRPLMHMNTYAYEGILGDQGPKGEVGPQGPIGLQGPTGDTGVNGTEGDLGITGDLGEEGIEGKSE